MRRLRELRSRTSGLLMANVGARVGALISVAIGTLLVARTGGPSAVGIYALLRVLPSLVGVLTSCGLPGAVTYFLAGPRREDPRLAATLIAMALAGGAAGALLWTVATPVLGPLLLGDLSIGLVLLAGVTVFTQLIVATAKSCSQGMQDMPGANLVILNEELLFLPAYVGLWFAGASEFLAVVGALLLADVATFVPACVRLVRRGLLRGAVARPSWHMMREISSYGWRQQIGGVITLLNLRLDFIILQLLVGPAVLGVYAIASKWAELLKVPSMALTYVLYPRYAHEGRAGAADARRLIPKAALITGGAAVPLLLAAPVVIPAFYGADFAGAVVPAQIIVLGLAADGIAGVVSGFLYGIGRPGLNSIGMGAGLVVTVVLDVALIPSLGAVGAALASAAAYLTSTAALSLFFWWLASDRTTVPWKRTRIPKGGGNMSLGQNGHGNGNGNGHRALGTWPPARVLVVAAHPDDETLGAGGTVARLAQNGSEVWVCLLCDGVTSRHAEVDLQRECAERACDVLGVSNVVFCELPDQRLDTLSLVEVITPIEDCVELLRPDLVMTHFTGDVNQDHRIVFDATMVATRPTSDTPVRTVLCYETASSTEWAAPFPGTTFSPNIFVDISSTLGQKLDAMSKYADTHISEVKEYPHPRSYEAIEVYAKRQGVLAGTAAAEPFQLIRGLL